MKRPNIVLIIMDTTRAKNMSCYGYHKKTTPFLDYLSKKSIVYENAVANSPWTLPSHASLFTGKYPHQHQLIHQHSKLPTNTLTQKLRQRGYYTIGASNNYAWVSELQNFHLGFNDFFLNIGKINDKLYKYFNLLNAGVIPSSLDNFFNFLTGDTGARDTNKYIKQKLLKAKSPFFLFINYMETHAPYRPPREYVELYNSNNLSLLEVYKLTSNQEKKKIICGRVPFTQEKRRSLENLYNGELMYLDQRIKELYYMIEDIIGNDNVVYIITSDHGEFLGEHKSESGKYNLLDHGWLLYQEVIHIPLIVKYPCEMNGKSNKRIELRELFYHILDISDGNTTIAESKQQFHFAEYYGFNPFQVGFNKFCPKLSQTQFNKPQVAIFYQNYKLILIREFGEMLFNLSKDTSESNNISKDNKDIVKKCLEARLNILRKDRV